MSTSDALDGRVYAIAGIGGGLGPVVAERFGAAGAIVAGDAAQETNGQRLTLAS